MITPRCIINLKSNLTSQRYVPTHYENSTYAAYAVIMPTCLMTMRSSGDKSLRV
jgi:hypothetical protein